MKLEGLLKKTSVEKFIIEHELYGVSTICTTAILKRKKLVSLMAVSESTAECINLVAKLFDKVNELEKNVPIPIPSLEKQPYNLGYYKEVVFKDDKIDYEVEYKRMDDIFYIKNIRRKTEDGFYIVDEPYQVPANFKFIQSTPAGDVYHWDNIRFLSGTAGEAIVKDGKVIKTKMTAMA